MNKGSPLVTLNNGYLGMVRQWQEIFYGKRYSSSKLQNPDFVKIAEAYGATGIRVTERDQVRPALERAIATDGPVFIDCFVECESNVWPMVPAGAALDQMMDMA
jgi:acetolactate synthase-1/2/3 large subunit